MHWFLTKWIARAFAYGLYAVNGMSIWMILRTMAHCSSAGCIMWGFALIVIVVHIAEYGANLIADLEYLIGKGPNWRKYL